MTINFAILGAGRIGQVHARAVTATPGARLVAISDPMAEAAGKVAEAYGCDIRSIDEIAASDDVQAVAICTPTNTHADLIEQFARAGKAVFCEKPIDLNLNRVKTCLDTVAAEKARARAKRREAAENGTARCAEALANGAISADLVVNFQGDAPLTPPWFVEELIAAMKADPGAQMATPVLQCDPATYDMFVEDRQNGRVGGTTAVFGEDHRALYFSKEIVPYIDPAKVPERDIPVYHHVGVYAYRPEALRSYTFWGVSRLETLEGLEQLRFLVHGVPVRCVVVESRGRMFWELNNPADVARIEKVLKEQ